MTSAGEVFVVQLARASRKANRFLRARKLSAEDRQDVIADALAWCWENRESYSLTTTLDTWFVLAVRDAYKKRRRGELPHRRALTEIPVFTTAEDNLAAWDAALTVIRAMPDEYKKVVTLQAQGMTRTEMMREGITKNVIDGARARVKQLRRLLPDNTEFQRAWRTRTHAKSTDGTERSADIDRAIARLDFPPAQGAECPPCWRCKWFEGYLPADRVSLRMEIQEPEVAEAVKRTEAEKIRIAREVRGGAL